MAWTEFTRRRYERSGGGYASDAGDAEWALIAPLMPAPKRIGRPRTTDLRDVFDAILHIATTGCQWRMRPDDTPPVPAVRRSFHGWRDNGLLEKLNLRRVAAARLAEGRAVTPAAGVIDSQSVKTTQSGGGRGYDDCKRIKGRKRRIVTDTAGLPIGLAVHAADVQDRDGAPALLPSIASPCPLLRHVFADGGYAGPELGGALEKIGHWSLQIVKRPDTAQGFEVIPRPSRGSHASHCRAADGSSDALSRGSDGAAEWRKTGRKPSPAQRRGSSSPTAGASRACRQGHDIMRRVSKRTLGSGCIVFRRAA